MPGPITPIKPKIPIGGGIKLDIAPFKVIDYTFNSLQVNNPDKSRPATGSGLQVVSGPGNTILGNLPSAILLGDSGKLSASLKDAILDFRFFCVRIGFQATIAVLNRQNLVESDLLPFAIYLEKTNGTDQFKIIANLGTENYGWTGIDSAEELTLKTNVHYIADLVFHGDTISLYVDGKLAGLRYLPKAELMKLSGNQLFLGTWIDGKRDHFPGKLTACQLHYKIPQKLSAKADQARQLPNWFISHRLQTKGPALGVALDKPTLFSTGYRQNFQNAQVHFSPLLGTAFVLEGAILNHYKQLSEPDREELGYLVGEEVLSSNITGRKTRFQKGAIYWSPNTGAVRVTGQMYLDFEELGEAAFLGFPKTKMEKRNGGWEQNFENGRIYLKDGAAKSFEVHGAILSRYLLVGSVDKLGFPVSNETDHMMENVFSKGNSISVAKVSHFEKGSIYWDKKGAFEISDPDILKKYQEIKGPAGVLGLPTSGTNVIPGTSNDFYNTFEKGSIVKFGNQAEAIVCLPFQVWVGRVTSIEIEGWGMGENDLSVDVYIEGNPGGTFHQRFPESGDYGNHNIVDVDRLLAPVIIPNDPNLSIVFRADVWDIDPGDNDLIGKYGRTLNLANAWGLQANNGVFNEGVQPRLKNLTWSIKQNVDLSKLTAEEWWWGVKNPGGPKISYDQYASAFSDVDSDPELLGIGDKFDQMFYELVVKNLAENGVCMGMCMETIRAWKGGSLFSLPLNRFNTKEAVMNEFYINHPRQVGAPAIWWFLGQVLSGNTHSPVDVFHETNRRFNLHENPVLCICQNYEFSGKPHVILPYKWELSGKMLRIYVYDPNFPSQGAGDPSRFVDIDPATNTFSYNGGSNQYSGGQWSGGRLYYMPWTVLEGRPRTPFWEAVLLLLSGTIMLLGSNANTDELTDLSGRPLDYCHPANTDFLKAGKALGNRFLAFKGLAGLNPVSSNLYFRQGLDEGRQLIVGRGPWDVPNTDYIHRFSGVAGNTAPVDYFIKTLRKQIKVNSFVEPGEQLAYTVRNLHRPTNSLHIDARKEKLVNMEISNRLDVRTTTVTKLDSIPVTPGKQLQVNLRPGIGGLEILPGNQSVDTVITIDTIFSGKNHPQKFPVRIEGGMRIDLASAVSNSEIIVSKIDQLHGEGMKPKIVRAL